MDEIKTAAFQMSDPHAQTQNAQQLQELAQVIRALTLNINQAEKLVKSTRTKRGQLEDLLKKI